MASVAASAVPLFATPRTPSRLTVGHEVADIMRSLSCEPMPWQAELANVANEIREDGQGFAYPTVIALIPRQAGKSLIALAQLAHRAQNITRGFSWYTSQTQSNATDMFRDQWLPLLESSEGIPYSSRLSNGSESITFPSKGKIGLFPPNRNGLHSKQSDLVVVDELWKFSSEQGKDISAGIGPTMATRPWHQKWLISAGADAHSGWLLELRKTGRKLAADTNSGVCFIEFHPAIDQFGNITDDLEDPAVWARVHPAVGHTIDIEFLRSERATDTAANFYRAYLNVPDLAPAESLATLIDIDAWNLCGDDTAALGTDPGLHLGYDLSPARNKGSLVLSRKLPDGRVLAELIDYADGVDWMPSRIYELQQRLNCKLVADSKGAVTTVTRALTDLGLRPRELTYREAQDGTAELLDDIGTKQLIHRRQPELDDAVSRVVPRRQENGAVLMARRTASGDISPVGALMASAFSARHVIVREPEFIFG